MRTGTCEACGRSGRRIIKIQGMMLCEKHYRQFKKHGKILDHNPRTVNDRNGYHIEGDVTYIELYDRDCNVIAEAKIDTEDLDKVKYTKWKRSASGYAMNTPKFKGGAKHMSRVILDTDQFVDHINHDRLDNRKQNLRIVNKSQNQMNVNYKGVNARPDGKFYAYIKRDGKMVNLGVYVFEEEAYYARQYAEILLFSDYRFPKELPSILPDRAADIQQYVEEKLRRVFGEENLNISNETSEPPREGTE